MLKSPANNSSSSDNNNFLPVNSIWICRDQYIIAESQIGSKSNNKKEKKFVKVFIEKIIQPSRSNKNDKPSRSFSIYVKKRKYLFHVLYANELTFLSLTTNTYHQQPLQEIFDVLYAVKTAYLYEDNLTFTDTLTDLHHSYQYKIKSKIISSMTNTNNNKLLLSPHSLTHYDDTNNTLNSRLIYDLCDSDGFNTNCLYSPTNTQNNMSCVSYNNISYNSRNTKLSNDTLNLSNLPSPGPSPTASNNNINTSASPSYSNNSCPFSDTPTGTYDGDNDTKIDHIISNKSNESNQTFKINHSLSKHSETSEDICEELEYFILKKGWMHKLGDRFSNWKFRYFELWSNGLLNYFDNEMKIKKKGSLNIVDEVINVQLYSKKHKENKQYIGEHGFLLTTHDRTWCFVVQKENVRNDWYLLIQTIAFNKKIDLNIKFKQIKLRLEKLQFKWERKFKHIERDIMTGEYEYNLYQLQYDLNIAVNGCKKCKKEIVYFCGSDVFALFTTKIEFISTGLQKTLETVNTIIHNRNETPWRKHRKQNNNKWYRKRKNNKCIKEENDMNCEDIKMNNSKSFENTQIVLKDKITIRLPSKKLIRSKNALSKKIKVLTVIAYDEYFRIDVNRENTAPLIWKFDEILNVKDIKCVCYGKNITSIKQFKMTIFHQSNRRVQFIFNDEKKAYLWHSKLKSLYDKANALHAPIYYENNGKNHQQIGV